MAFVRNYSKRQVIDVSDFETIDFEEDILLCVPRFAWIVARSFLSVQASWISSYAVEHFSSGYETPTTEQKDIIDANLARFLEETDMSCDLEAVLEQMVDQLSIIAQKDCSVTLSCAQGSSGAGGSEAGQSPFEDGGVDPPYGFADYSAYDAFKCGVAHWMVDQLKADIEYIKGLALFEISAVIFGATLLTPIPGDELGALAGAILVLFLEGALDALMDEIIAAIVGDGDELVCALYLAFDVPTARLEFNNWTAEFLSTSAQYILTWWRGNDALNALFEKGNFILPSDSCAACADPVDLVFDSFTDDDDVLLTAHTPEEGGPWLGVVGTWKITDAQARGDGTTWSRVQVETDLGDGICSVILAPASGSKKTAYQGILFRGDQDGLNNLEAGWVGGGSSGYWIAKRENDSRSELEFVSAPATYETRTLKVQFEGSAITLFVNGIPVLTTETDFNEQETFMGMVAGEAGGARFDNFRVQPV